MICSICLDQQYVLLVFHRMNCLQSSTVDRQHAVIDIDELGESYVLQDLNTTYGTYVNDCRIENAAIRLLSGDVIRFGNSNILYEFVASGEPAVSKTSFVKHNVIKLSNIFQTFVSPLTFQIMFVSCHK